MPMPVSIRHRLDRSTRRGFSMIEMLAVIAFIGFVAAAAAPTYVEVTRDRRVDAAALAIADIYRTGRARAMGRGAAVVVRWDANAPTPTVAQPQGHFTMREAIAGPTGISSNLPTASCFTPDWSDASTTSKYVVAFDERAKRYEPAAATFLDDTGTTQNFSQICFTPRGRTYVRYANNGAFSVMTGVPRVQVANTVTNFNRFVPLPPHGSARVVAQLQ